MLSSSHGNDVDITAAGLALDIVARGNYMLLAEFKERLDILIRNQFIVYVCVCVRACVSAFVHVLDVM